MSETPDLPPLLDATVQLGIVRMRSLVGDSPANTYRPRICLLVDNGSGMVLHFEISKPEDDDFSLVGTAFQACVNRIGGFPRQILTRIPRLVTQLKPALAKYGVDIVVRESLPQLDEAMESLQGTVGGGSRKPEPSLMDAKGMTLDHVIGFAEAGKLFYDARPWQYLLDDDLIEIHSPAGPSGTRFTQVLGAAGQVMGLGFARSRQAHEDIQAGRGLPEGTLWNLLYGTLDELPFDDGELWETHNLPASGPDGYPRLARITAARKPGAPPKMKDIAWAEGLLRALAATTETQYDSGEWEQQVETAEGPAVYKFSMPILLEQLNETQGSNTGMPRRPEIIMEQMLRGLGQEVARRGVETPEDLEQITGDMNKGKLQPDFVPQTAAEKAQALSYKAYQSRGRRQIQLAKEALAIDPDCVDALYLVAERKSDPAEKIPLLRQCVAAGERQFGDTFFEENTGHFWGITETRPYMRARCVLAAELLKDEQWDEGIGHLQKLLELNPNDNQGNRYMLADALRLAGRDDDLAKLLNESRYADETSPDWMYSRALLEFRKTGDSPAARARFIAADQSFPLIAGMLSGDVRRMNQFTGLSDDQLMESQEMMNDIVDDWSQTDGALEWAQTVLATKALTQKQLKKLVKRKSK